MNRLALIPRLRGFLARRREDLILAALAAACAMPWWLA